MISGAQDWFSLVNFEDPQLIYNLHCKFNRQMNMDGSRDNLVLGGGIFDKFHSCDGRLEFDKDNALIVHVNGPWTNFGDYQIEKQFEGLVF